MAAAFPTDENVDGAHPFLERVVLRNYRSIAGCDVRLQSLTFLVGPNGSGKSNFLDALRFVANALRMSLDYAIRERGGAEEVLRRTARDQHFGVRLEFFVPLVGRGHYAFRVRIRSFGGYEVDHEECVVYGSEESGRPRSFFRVQMGAPITSVTVAPPASSDRLYLVNASGLPEFRPVHDALSQMAFYNINPDRLREPQAPDAGGVLARDGSNATTIVREMLERDPHSLLRVEQYLGAIVPGLRQVQTQNLGSREILQFLQRDPDTIGEKWRFSATGMSDGTLRALGILLALFQRQEDEKVNVPLVGIEEPEASLHPAAAGVLLDSLSEASTRRQVLVTSHSPDLLDSTEISPDAILAVTLEHGTTRIGPIDDVERSVLRDRLCSAGELLRQNQLRPDEKVVVAEEHARLFDQGPDGW